jgi:hypothetical protein
LPETSIQTDSDGFSGNEIRVLIHSRPKPLPHYYRSLWERLLPRMLCRPAGNERLLQIPYCQYRGGGSGTRYSALLNNPPAGAVIEQPDNIRRVISALGYRDAIRPDEAPVVALVLVAAKAAFVHQRVVFRAQRQQVRKRCLAVIVLGDDHSLAVTAQAFWGLQRQRRTTALTRQRLLPGNLS